MAAFDEAGLEARIYEAAFVPEIWPSVLDGLAATVGGVGGLLFTSNLQQVQNWTSSGSLQDLMQDWVAGGWQARNQRTRRMVERQHAGFVTERDVFTPGEIETDAEHVEFLRPRGFGSSTGTFLPMPTGDVVVYSIECPRQRGPITAEEVLRLDRLRPHLARSGAIAARLGLDRARTVTDMFGSIGLPAAALSLRGRLMTANARFEALMPALFQDRAVRLMVASRSADRLLATAIAAGPRGQIRPVASIPIERVGDLPPHVAHLLPVKGLAHDIFSRVGWICAVVPVVPGQVPGAEVLQALFDLTPAEARIARALGEALTVDEMATAFGLSRETIRSHLKGVRAKTGVNRQAELAALIAGISLPR